MDERKRRVDKALNDLKEHTDPKEGPIEDLITDEMWLSEYVGIRVTKHGFGVKFVCSVSPEDVYVAVRNDRKKNPDSVYYFFKPIVEGMDREGLLMGGSEA